eukprot:TRINITY_DN14425_c0_g1_i4.p1 TRINITY_DN14425_c0_g1~~TRINITY_DN14425_c0_g1_i4.p1  ORF type:complete len:277 (+),score=28.12 TRINITY_DN14425_c0_g1_i4:23-832(+)
MELVPARVEAWLDAGAVSSTSPRLGKPTRVSLKEVLQGVRELVGAADLHGALEVLDNLVADVVVDKPLLDVEHWKHLSWPIRRRKAVALVGGDQESEATETAPTDYVGAKKPGGHGMAPLPQLGRTQICSGTIPSNVSPTTSGRAGAASSRDCSTSRARTSRAMGSLAAATASSAIASGATSWTATARATKARTATATLMLGKCPASEAECRQCVAPASRRLAVDDVDADSFEDTDYTFHTSRVESIQLPSRRRELFSSEASRKHKAVA